ncbi:MAG: hypothetical protein KGZ73_03875 [Rhizobiales bacterium]|jgi:hypothetical protein|nr:hypothetical protein [Hyphomicrobiales bacterium]
MKKLFSIAAFAAAAFLLTVPADAQVSTKTAKVKPTYTCKAKPAKGKRIYTGVSRKNVSFARSSALNSCRKVSVNKSCKVTSCVG